MRKVLRPVHVRENVLSGFGARQLFKRINIDLFRPGERGNVNDEKRRGKSTR